jgi:protein-S-isoprenylcysteine O-methyltransferase Ste14
MLVQTAVWLAITAAFLFVPAGTLDWPEAWVLLAEFGVLGLISGYLIAQHDPELLRERMRSPIQGDQKSWDKILLPIVFALWLAQYVVIALDAVRYHTSEVPLWLKVVGALAIAFGLYVFHIVMRANTFAAPVVKIQTERKHQVIDTGPYAYVRHPMYAGAIPLLVGTPLLLGSWRGLAFSLVLIVIFAVRAVLEEEMLRSELAGYDAYAARVRWRLVPGVW